jgi:hypothetical protein
VVFQDAGQLGELRHRELGLRKLAKQPTRVGLVGLALALWMLLADGHQFGGQFPKRRILLQVAFPDAGQLGELRQGELGLR